MKTSFYDPQKSYEENFKTGPFGAFADGRIFNQPGQPGWDFFGLPAYSPFGIPAGPLLNANFIKAALDKGFDLVSYKTVRTAKFASHSWPNIVALNVKKNLTLQQARAGLKAVRGFTPPLSITNSFGVPSSDPDVWQEDLAKAASFSKPGQIVIGSFQGTASSSRAKYIQDFVDCARMVKETGVKVLEANFSCPNEGNGKLLCFDINTAREVIEAVKNEIGNLPLIVKLAYFQDQAVLEKFVGAAGTIVQGIEAINTVPAKILDDQGSQYLPGQGRLISGVCGQGIKWAGLGMVNRLKDLRERKKLKFTIIGVGGVFDVRDFQDYRKAGADIVMSATGAMWNPLLGQAIKQTPGQL